MGDKLYDVLLYLSSPDREKTLAKEATQKSTCTSGETLTGLVSSATHSQVQYIYACNQDLPELNVFAFRPTNLRRPILNFGSLSVSCNLYLWELDEIIIPPWSR